MLVYVGQLAGKNVSFLLKGDKESRVLLWFLATGSIPIDTGAV